MANFGSLPITLVAEKDTPAQLILFKITTPLAENEAYGTSAGDTFQGQTSPIPRKQKTT
jgi:hypothetical protein